MERKTCENKHERRVTFRLTETEYKKVKEWADSAGMSISEFMRNAVRSDKINLTYTVQATFPDVTDAVKEMAKSMSKTSNSLNQIARWLNGGNNADSELTKAVVQMQTDIGAIRREMDKIENLVNSSFKSFERMGRDDSSNLLKSNGDSGYCCT